MMLWYLTCSRPPSPSTSKSSLIFSFIFFRSPCTNPFLHPSSRHACSLPLSTLTSLSIYNALSLSLSFFLSFFLSFSFFNACSLISLSNALSLSFSLCLSLSPLLFHFLSFSCWYCRLLLLAVRIHPEHDRRKCKQERSVC